MDENVKQGVATDRLASPSIAGSLPQCKQIYPSKFTTRKSFRLLTFHVPDMKRGVPSRLSSPARTWPSP